MLKRRKKHLQTHQDIMWCKTDGFFEWREYKSFLEIFLILTMELSLMECGYRFHWFQIEFEKSLEENSSP
jgi:hypothetical protein